MKIQLKLILTLLLFISVTACSDDSSTSPDLDEAPDFPSEISPATINLSYFQNQNVPDDENHVAYKTVEQIAYSGGGALQAGGMLNLASVFLTYAQFMNIDPEFENGSWVWTINFSENMFEKTFQEDFENLPLVNSEQITLKILAKPVNGGTQWTLRFSGDLGDGEVVDDFQLMTGFTSDDEMSGEWNFFLPETGSSSYITYQWNMESETKFTSNISVNEGGQTYSVDYEKDGHENWMWFNDGTDSAQVYWNESTNSGWFEDETGNRMCYTDFENTAC